jgi:hypothetical protein
MYGDWTSGTNRESAGDLTDNHDNLVWVLDRLLLAADAVQAAQREAGASVNGEGIVTLQLVIESQALIRHAGSGLGSPT